MLLLLAALSWADPPPCSWPDGREGLCFDEAHLRDRAEMRADLKLARADLFSCKVVEGAARQELLQALRQREEAQQRLDRAKRQRWVWVGVGVLAGGGAVLGGAWAVQAVAR